MSPARASGILYDKEALNRPHFHLYTVKTRLELPELRCAKCGHAWVPRTEQPKACPRCKARRWRSERAAGAGLAKPSLTVEERLKIVRETFGAWRGHSLLSRFKHPAEADRWLRGRP